MLNPLAKHRSTPADDFNEDRIDIESPISLPDSPGYIGKKIHFLKSLLRHDVLNDHYDNSNPAFFLIKKSPEK
jgi:hypothetical protein